MLAQNFKSAADLEITEPQKEALIKTLVLLETGRLVHVADEDARDAPEDAKPRFTGHFNMGSWGSLPSDCGTIACIGGTAELIAGMNIFNSGFLEDGPLMKLFYPPGNWNLITVDQAATALRSYLTTGDARWDLAVAS